MFKEIPLSMLPGRNSPVLTALGHGKSTEQPEPGILVIGHFSLDLLLYGKNAFWEGLEGAYITGAVVDSLEQLKETPWYKALEAHEDPFVLSLTHIAKDPSNKGQGGGWRWHKWCEYMGNGTPTVEYLDDEPEFADGVWVVSSLPHPDVMHKYAN